MEAVSVSNAPKGKLIKEISESTATIAEKSVGPRRFPIEKWNNRLKRLESPVPNVSHPMPLTRS